jgi:hypothetical protein
LVVSDPLPIQKLPDAYKLPGDAGQISIGPAPDGIADSPLPWPCPVCGGIFGEEKGKEKEKESVLALIEVTYPDGRENRFVVTAHKRSL